MSVIRGFMETLGWFICICLVVGMIGVEWTEWRARVKRRKQAVHDMADRLCKAELAIIQLKKKRKATA